MFWGVFFIMYGADPTESFYSPIFTYYSTQQECEQAARELERTHKNARSQHGFGLPTQQFNYGCAFTIVN